MLELKTETCYEVLKHLAFVIAKLPKEFYDEYYDPVQLVGKEVSVNGKVFTVHNVETYMINRSPEHPYKLSCGLLVK